MTLACCCHCATRRVQGECFPCLRTRMQHCLQAVRAAFCTFPSFRDVLAVHHAVWPHVLPCTLHSTHARPPTYEVGLESWGQACVRVR
eukprot:4167856-Alexandrium_andersonii.AAC.1